MDTENAHMTKVNKGLSPAIRNDISTLQRLLREALLLSLRREGKKDRPATRLQLVADALVDAAFKGDAYAANEIFNRVGGKQPQTVSREGRVRVTVH